MDLRNRQAHRMIEAFTSVGAKHFDASRVDIDGNKVAFRPDLTSAELKRMLPARFGRTPSSLLRLAIQL